MAAIENQEGTSDNNLSIVLSASESSVDREHDSSDNNEDEDSAENEKGLQPYRFEPYESDNEPNVGSDSPVSSDQDEGAVGGAVEENGFPEQDINRLQNTEWSVIQIMYTVYLSPNQFNIFASTLNILDSYVIRGRGSLICWYHWTVVGVHCLILSQYRIFGGWKLIRHIINKRKYLWIERCKCSYIVPGCS